MTNLFNALEHCLAQIENGADVESVLKQYPDFADELRPILKTAVKAQQSQVAAPSPEAIRRGRAKVMQRAVELQQSPRTIRKNTIQVFSRLAISFSLALVFLLSGTGLLSASASALPGDRLYSVKRSWENIRLSLIFDQEARDLLKIKFEDERLREVNELLSKGKSETVQFAGIFLQANGMNYVSGVLVAVSANTSLPSSGEAVIVTGQTNPDGFVVVFNLELLPVGTVVPIGNPIQIEIQPPLPAPQTDIVYFEIQGTLQSVSASSIIVNGQTLYIDAAKVTGQLCVGSDIKAKGYYTAGNRFIAIEVFGNDTCPTVPVLPPSSGNNSNSSNDGNSGNAGNSNNDNDDDDNDGDDDDDNNDD
ncbi:MAG: hypothetical protein JNK81_14530 [Anaerolineales bacterium]|nr:hypothetical protein [Anaerolineales bacterium]